MTRETDPPIYLNCTVVTFDICSSSLILEDLLKQGKIEVWRNVLIDVKDFLLDQQKYFHFDLYKFIGDGWILLFEEKYSGAKICELISMLINEFEEKYLEKISPLLDITPPNIGLTFGIDEGEVVKFFMNGAWEYTGYPINVACRLQGVIEDTDIESGHRVFISSRLYLDREKEYQDFSPEPDKRVLRNLGGGKPFKCHRLLVYEVPFRIIYAYYGIEGKWMDVTQEYRAQIRGGRLRVKVSNKIIGDRDPAPHIEKTLRIRYSVNGEIFDQEFLEKTTINLPQPRNLI